MPAQARQTQAASAALNVMFATNAVKRTWRLRLAIRAERSHSGEDYDAISNDNIIESAHKALAQQLEGSEFPALDARRMKVKRRSGARPGVMYYGIEVPCQSEGQMKFLRAAIMHGGCLCMDWGRQQEVMAMLYDGVDPTNAHYFATLSIPDEDMWNAKTAMQWLKDNDVGVSWVAVQPPSYGQPLGLAIVPEDYAGTDKAPDLSHVSWPAKVPRFLALVSGGHPFFTKAAGGVDVRADTGEVFTIHATRLLPRLPPARARMTAAQAAQVAPGAVINAAELVKVAQAAAQCKPSYAAAIVACAPREGAAGPAAQTAPVVAAAQAQALPAPAHTVGAAQNEALQPPDQATAVRPAAGGDLAHARDGPSTALTAAPLQPAATAQVLEQAVVLVSHNPSPVVTKAGAMLPTSGQAAATAPPQHQGMEPLAAGSSEALATAVAQGQEDLPSKRARRNDEMHVDADGAGEAMDTEAAACPGDLREVSEAMDD